MNIHHFDSVMHTPKQICVLVLAVLLSLIAGHAVAETGKPPDPEAAKRGQPLYDQYCKSCHGANGVGEPAIPPSLRLPGYFSAPALDDSQHAWHHSDQDLVRVILEGSRRTQRMPAWKSVLSRQDALDIVAYMKSLWSARALECQGPKHMSCM
jgi:mono/diheme cytochrome c family protein